MQEVVSVISRILLTVFSFLLLSFISIHAQMNERVYATPYQIDSTKNKQLSVEFDNLSFFKNDEFEGEVVKGYTLPGFWAQLKAVYYPLPNVKIEAGIHGLRYWGARKYPAYAYQDIALWQADQYQHGFRINPFFRGQIALSDKWNIVLGSLYGGATHRLIEPLYNPELNLMADPETGVQVLFHSKHFDVDAWMNWESFIFKNDVHQEAFMFGISSRVKFNNPTDEWHFYAPIQALAQHRGGELDTLTHKSVQTLMNGVVGLGTQWNVNRGVLKNLSAEVDVVGYYQQAGELWPFDNGYGVYARLGAEVAGFNFKAAYWSSNDFISLMGNPLYGAVSTAKEGATFKKPKLLHVGAEYSRTLSQAVSFGIDIDLIHRFSNDMTLPDQTMQVVNGATSITFGIYMRLSPSFLIKKF